MAKDVQPTLETERLILRPFDLSDGSRVQMLAGDEAIASTTLNIPHPYEDGMAEEWIRTHPEGYEKGEFINFAIVLKAGQELIGAIGLTLRQKHVHAEIGYWIGKPYWNQGYCTEAAREVIRYGFETLNLHRIHAMHLSRNPASGKVMSKSRMSHEGTRHEHIFKWDVFENVELYGLLRSEYEQVRGTWFTEV
jgi:ribosomal-protein-alanine N-acetyltransferase